MWCFRPLMTCCFYWSKCNISRRKKNNSSVLFKVSSSISVYLSSPSTKFPWNLTLSLHRFGFCRKLIKLAKSIVFAIYSSLLIKIQRDTLIMRRCRGGVKICAAMVITECLWQALGICGEGRHPTCSGKLGTGRCIFLGTDAGNGSELSPDRTFFTQRLPVGGG